MYARAHFGRSTKPGSRTAVAWRRLLALLPVLLLLASRVEASTTIFTNTGSVCTATAPCWQAGMFGMLVGLGSSVGATGSIVLTGNNSVHIEGAGTSSDGEVGVGSGSFFTALSNTESLDGPIDFADSGTTTSHGFSVPSVKDSLTATTILGGTLTHYGYVTQALNQVLSMNTYWTSQSGTSIGALTGGSLGTAGKGVEVFKATSINIGSTLTLTGTTGDLIIIDAPSAIFTKNVVLNGLTSDQVLFNLSGTSGVVLSINGGVPKDTISADFILRGSMYATATTVNGRILGGWGTLTLAANFDMEEPAPIADLGLPEPSTWILMAGGMAVLLYAGRRFGVRSPLTASGPLEESIAGNLTVEAAPEPQVTDGDPGGGARGPDAPIPVETPPPRGGGGPPPPHLKL